MKELAVIAFALMMFIAGLVAAKSDRDKRQAIAVAELCKDLEVCPKICLELDRPKACLEIIYE